MRASEFDKKLTIARQVIGSAFAMLDFLSETMNQPPAWATECNHGVYDHIQADHEAEERERIEKIIRESKGCNTRFFPMWPPKPEWAKELYDKEPKLDVYLGASRNWGKAELQRQWIEKNVEQWPIQLPVNLRDEKYLKNIERCDEVMRGYWREMADAVNEEIVKHKNRP